MGITYWKTTVKDFEVFKEEAQKWICIFGLFYWDVDFQHVELLGNDAEVEYDLESHIASMRLSTKVSQKNAIRKFAFHETCELLMARMQTVASARDSNEKMIEEARHEIIRILENSLFKGLNGGNVTSGTAKKTEGSS